MSGWRDRRVGRFFRLGEFFPSGHRREPPEAAVAALRHLCRNYLDPMRANFGTCIVHSGYRSEARNTAVGGAPRSYHRYDLRGWDEVAADVSFARGTPSRWASVAVARGAPGVGIYPTHVHVDNRQGQKVLF